MKKYLIALTAIVFIVGLSIRTFAAFPGSITLGGVDNACEAFDSCFPLVPTNVVTAFFDPGIYTFTVASGAWSSFNLGTTDLGGEKWFWSMFIYQGSTGMEYELGSSTPYDSPSEALSQNTGAMIPPVTVSGSGENLLFYIKDIQPRDNGGSITVAVIPEPVSSTLFVVGGALLAGRRFRRRKRER